MVCQMNVMRWRRKIIGLVAVTGLGLLTLWLYPSPMRRNPPVLTDLSVERADIVDDTGSEMWMVDFGLSNSSPPSASPEGLLFVKDLETRSGNRWLRADGPTYPMFPPGRVAGYMLLFSPHMGAGQLRFKYTGASRLFGGESWRGAWRRFMQRVPWSIRRRFPKADPDAFEFPRYVPSSDWQEMIVDIPLPPANPAQSR